MTSEANPELGAITYSYDSASGCTGTYTGDLVKRSDSIYSVCYAYDALHRPTLATFISGTNQPPVATFVYDAATVNGITMQNPKGRMVEAYTGPSNAKITDLGLSYSNRGEVADMYQSTPHSNGYYHVTQGYWENGAIKTLTSTGLPTFSYNADGEGRPTTVSASTGTNPVTNAAYNVFSEATSVTFGSSDVATFNYDASTGRMTKYQETINGSAIHGDLLWNQNGTLQTLTITDPFNASDAQTCAYLYDDLGRVGNKPGDTTHQSVDCGAATWQQKFTYDVFGNLTKSGSLTWNPGYDPTNNHYTLGGVTYDANGNLTYDLDHHYTWDGNGRMITVDSVPGTVNLTYDALGNQVEKNVSGVFTQYVYAAGRKLAQMSGQTLTKAYVPLPGGTQALYAPNLGRYRIPDWLGSIRIESKSDRTFLWSGALAPFGEQYANSGTTSTHTFAQINADTAGDLYDATAREIHSSQGRWISPDPAGLGAVDLTDPQSWNRYAYVGNNPLILVDPLGLEEGEPCPSDKCVPEISPYPYRDMEIAVVSGDLCEFLGFCGRIQVPGEIVNVIATAPKTISLILSTVKGWIPNICAGGGFGYGAANFPLSPKVNVESIGLVEYDSKEGGSHGGVLGLEVGPTVTGVESLRTWNDWQAHTGPVFIGGEEFSAASSKFGKNIKPDTFDAGGFGNWMNGQLSVGGYLGGKVFGGGGYLSLSWSGCKP